MWVPVLKCRIMKFAKSLKVAKGILNCQCSLVFMNFLPRREKKTDARHKYKKAA